MPVIFNSKIFCNLLLFITLMSFSMTYAIATPTDEVLNRPYVSRSFPKPKPEDIERLSIHLRNLMDELSQLEQTGPAERMIDIMLEVKNEIESVYGGRFSIGETLDKIENDIIKAIGSENMSRKDMERLWKRIDEFKDMQKKRKKEKYRARRTCVL